MKPEENRAGAVRAPADKEMMDAAIVLARCAGMWDDAPLNVKCALDDLRLAIDNHCQSVAGAVRAGEVMEAHTGPADRRIYVTCHQCDLCPTESACNRGACGWHGPTPAEDLCPECGEPGTMAEALPKCGGYYRFLADADVLATIPPSDEPLGRV